ncbi:DUF6301 family protein [Nocardia sp. 004]|uniref:DUF6301 family protein n=1 Tax=Nocardia sp. 004 TaxID=3385978 RepID=UPI0039A3B866
MKSDIEGAVRLARTAMEFDWTWQAEDLPPFCEKVDWQVSEIDENGATLVTTLDVFRKDAIVFFSADSSGRISWMTLFVADVESDCRGVKPSAEQADIYSLLETRIIKELGPPDRRLPDRGEPKTTWDLENVCIELYTVNSSIAFHIVNPEYQELLDEPILPF